MLRASVLCFAVSTSLCAAPARIVFTKTFPGSIPAFVEVSVDKVGSVEYREQKDELPTKALLPETDTAVLFSLADKLGNFKTALESGLKVANTGKKTFRYEDESGNVTEVVFNYSTIEDAKDLLNRFEDIAATERAYLELDKAAHFDPLGVNDALAQIEALWLRKELVAPLQFLPLLKRVATHENYMHLARDRAARLKDEFTGIVANAANE